MTKQLDNPGVKQTAAFVSLFIDDIFAEAVRGGEGQRNEFFYMRRVIEGIKENADEIEQLLRQKQWLA